MNVTKVFIMKESLPHHFAANFYKSVSYCVPVNQIVIILHLVRKFSYSKQPHFRNFFKNRKKISKKENINVRDIKNSRKSLVRSNY